MNLFSPRRRAREERFVAMLCAQNERFDRVIAKHTEQSRLTSQIARALDVRPLTVTVDRDAVARFVKHGGKK